MSTNITASMVNELRTKTGGVGLMDCKKALIEANGNFDTAIEILRKKGIATAAKKASREAAEGVIESYIHFGNKIGVMLELNCETDFVAKNDSFRQLAKEICMHIAAFSPLYIRKEDVPHELVEKEKEITAAQCEGKPPAAVEQMVAGRINKWFGQICLLDQSFFKDQDKTIQDLITEKIAQMGENIVVTRFTRFQVGEKV